MDFDKIKITPLLKVNLGKYKRESSYIDTYNLGGEKINKLSNVNILTKKPRPIFHILKEEKDVIDFNIFNYKYSFGFFAGCDSFSFRVTFKEYKQGLKASKFSLLLNQFNLNIERFTDLIEEILVNNFSFDFYENLFGSTLNDMDLKIHFQVILRNKKTLNKNIVFFFKTFNEISLFLDRVKLLTLSPYYFYPLYFVTPIKNISLSFSLFSKYYNIGEHRYYENHFVFSLYTTIIKKLFINLFLFFSLKIKCQH